MPSLRLVAIVALLYLFAAVRCEEIDISAPLLATDPEIVDLMLQLAQPTAADVLVDLGSGDGRIVAAAVKNFGVASGHGYELIPSLVDESVAKSSELPAGRASFHAEDVFKANLTTASIVTLYLQPETVGKLEEKLLQELKPGSRIISHDYPLPTIVPDVEFSTTHPSKVNITGVDLVVLYMYTVFDPLAPHQDTVEMHLPALQRVETIVRVLARKSLCALPLYHPCVTVELVAEGKGNFEVFTMKVHGGSQLKNIEFSITDAESGKELHTSEVSSTLSRDSFPLNTPIAPGSRIRLSIKKLDPAAAFKAHRLITLKAHVAQFRQYESEILEVEAHPTGLGARFLFGVNSGGMLGIWFQRFPIAPTATIQVKAVGGEFPFPEVIFSKEQPHDPAVTGWPHAVDVTNFSAAVDLIFEATFVEFTRDHEATFFIDNAKAFSEDLANPGSSHKKSLQRVSGSNDVSVEISLTEYDKFALRVHATSTRLHYIQVFGYDGVHNVLFAFECLERLPEDPIFNRDKAVCATVGLDKFAPGASVRGNLVTVSVLFNLHTDESIRYDQLQTEFTSLGGGLEEHPNDKTIAVGTHIFSAPLASIIHAENIPQLGDDVFDALQPLQIVSNIERFTVALIRLALTCVPAYAAPLPFGDRHQLIAEVHKPVHKEAPLPFQLVNTSSDAFGNQLMLHEAARAQKLLIVEADTRLRSHVNWYPTVFKNLATFEAHVARVSRKAAAFTRGSNPRLYPVIVPYMMPPRTASAADATAELRLGHEVIQLYSVKPIDGDSYSSFMARSSLLHSGVTIQCTMPRILSTLMHGVEDHTCEDQPF